MNPVCILMIEDDEGHARLIERNIRRAGVNNEIVPFRDCRLVCYLPWEDRWATVDAPTLPPFKRSIVVRVPADAVEGVVRAH